MLRLSVEAGLVDVGGLGVLHVVLEVFKQAAVVEQPGHQVGGDPVGHDAGQHLVDVEEGLHQAGDAPPQGPGQGAPREGDDPHQGGGHHGGGDGQGQDQGGGGAHQVLARRADVEQAGLVGYRHGQAGEDQGGGPEEHVPHIGGVEAEGEGAGGVPPRAEQAGEHQADPLPHGARPHGGVEQAHQDHDDGAHRHADEDGDEGGQHRLGALLGQQAVFVLFHAPSPSFCIRLAPAM